MKKRILALLLIGLIIPSVCFGYTRDWDPNSPIDHSLNKNWPSEDRKTKADVGERLDDILNGFDSGDTVTDFNRIPAHVQASDETGVADTIIIYGKDVSTKTELFTVDEDDNVIQITTAGLINSDALSGSGLPSAWQDKVWPVGSIYISYVSTNPNTLLGFGTWTAFGAGKVLIGLDSGDADFDSVGETGGSKTMAHTHSVSGTTSVSGTLRPGSQAAGTGLNSGTGNVEPQTFSVTSGAASNDDNLPPYITVYMWRRTL